MDCEPTLNVAGTGATVQKALDKLSLALGSTLGKTTVTVVAFSNAHAQLVKITVKS